VGEEPAAQPTEIVPSGATFKAEGKPSGGPNEGFIDGGSRAVDKAGNIRLDLLDAPADVDQAIRDAARYNSDYQTERRGVVSDGQLLDLADALGIDASFLDAKKVGDAFTAEEIVAARMLLVESASQVKNMMAAAAEGGDVVELAKAIARHEMIQGKVAQATAEWGRAGHAFQLLSKVSKETDVDALNTLLKENTGRSYDQLMQMAALGRNLQTPSQVSRFVQATKNQRISRALVYYYTNALISGPFTHAVYVLGNQLRSALMPVETATQAAIGSARSLVMTDPDRVYWKEVGASLDGLMYGTPAAFRPALDAFKAGQQLPLPGQKLYTNPWGTYQPLIPAAIDNAVGLPGRSVAAIHQFSRVVFYEQFLRRLATRQAMAEGLSGDELTGRIAKLISSPPDEMMQNAADRADTEMFQRRSSFTGPLAAISRATDNYPLAKLFFPFIKIGVEIQRETFVKRTPLGLLSPEVRGQLLMREGGAAFDEAAGKQVLGLSLLGAGVGFAATGITTGYGPTDPKARSSWLLTHQPYSVTIGNLSVPYQGLGPPGKLLQFGADLFETHHYWDEKDGAALAASYVKAVARATLDESFFTDMTSLNDAISDPGRHGARWLTGFAAGFVPYSSFLGQTNRHIIDPYSKDVSPGIEGIFDNIRARIPVASWDIPNRVDMFGEDIPSRGIYGGFMPELRWHNDPTAQWLNRIQVGPGRVDRSIWGVRLTELQYHDLQQQSGRLSKQLLDAVREQLQGQPRGVQLKEIDRLIGEARSATRKQIAMQSIGSDNDIVAKAVKLKEQAFQ
jgi:hypothetical protein